MPVIGDVTAKIGADDSGLRRGIDGAGKWSANKFKAIGAAAAASFAGAFAVGKFRDSIDRVAKIRELAEQTGLSAEEFQRLDYQMRQAGGTTEDVVRGMNTLDRQMAKAREGNEQSIKDFERLGITIKDIANPDRMQIMLRLSEAVNSMTAESRGGALEALRRLLNDDAARKFVGAFQEDFVQGLENAKVISDDVIDSMKELTGIIQDLNDSVLRDMAEILSNSKDDIKQMITDLQPLIGPMIRGVGVIGKGLSIFKNQYLNPVAAEFEKGIGGYMDLAYGNNFQTKDASPEFKRREEIQSKFQQAQLEVLKQIRDKTGSGASTDIAVMGGL